MKKFLYLLILLILIFVLVRIFSNNSNEKKLNDFDSTNEYVHEFFNTEKFDKTKFSGVMYDFNLKEIKVLELLKKEENISIKNNISKYFFTKDIEKESKKLNTQNRTNPANLDINYLINILGNPSTIYEKYSESEYNGVKKISGQASLLYNYYDYIIEILLWDYRKWPEKNITDLSYYGINIYTSEYFKNNLKRFYNGFECYGENIFD